MVDACVCVRVRVDDPTKPGLLVLAQYFNQTVEQHLYMYSAPNVTALRSSRTSLTLPVELTILKVSALDSASFDLLGRMAFALQSSSDTSYVFDANRQVLYSGPWLNGTVKLQHCRYSSVLTMIELDPVNQAYIRLMNSSSGFVHREVHLTRPAAASSQILPLTIDPITCNIALQLKLYTSDHVNITVDGEEIMTFSGPLSFEQEFEILLIIKFAADFSPSFQNSTIFLNEHTDSKLDSYILSAVFQPETSDLYACFIKKWEITPVKNTTGIVIVRLAAADLSQTMIRHAKPYTDYNTILPDSGNVRLVYDMFRDRVLMLGLTTYFVSWKDSCDSNAADLSPYVDLIPSLPDSGPPKNNIVTTTTIKDRKWLTLFCDGMRAIAHASSSEQLLFSNNPVPLVLETLLATAVVVFVVVVVVARHRGQFQRAPRVAATLATANDWLRELVVGGAPRGIGRFEHVPTQAIPVCCALGPIEHCSDRDGQ
jgi:hypothetical protein